MIIQRITGGGRNPINYRQAILVIKDLATGGPESRVVIEGQEAELRGVRSLLVKALEE